jgi:cytochrome b561
MKRRQRAGQTNRAVGWLLLPVLIGATVTYHGFADEGGAVRALAGVLSGLLVVLTFLHAGLSFYVFGYVRPRRTLRVFHVYFGYLTFVLVMLSQTTIEGPEAFHLVTSVLMYAAIAIHTIIGVRYQVIRRKAQLLNPELVPANTR